MFKENFTEKKKSSNVQQVNFSARVHLDWVHVTHGRGQNQWTPLVVLEKKKLKWGRRRKKKRKKTRLKKKRGKGEA